jgi:hypothetical protein
MEIIIRTDDPQTTSAAITPTPTAPAEPQPSPDLLARAAVSNAINAGAAPQPPGALGAPPAHIVAASSATDAASDVSAGKANF